MIYFAFSLVAIGILALGAVLLEQNALGIIRRRTSQHIVRGREGERRTETLATTVPESVRQSIVADALADLESRGQMRLVIDGAVFFLKLQQTAHDTRYYAIEEKEKEPKS